MIFVTGGTGLIGSHLLLNLVRTGHRVRALKRAGSNTMQVLKTFGWYEADAPNLFSRIEWVEGNLQDIFSIEPLLEGVDTIYHCAGMVSFERKDRRRLIAENAEGTANLVDAALHKGVRRICHVSSVSALGKSGNDEPITEETSWVPSKKISGYSRSKFFSEAEIWRGVEEGLEAVVVNPTIVVGPGTWKNGSSGFFRVIHQGMKFYPVGTTGFVDVLDVADAMMMLMDPANFESARNQRYLINGENLTYHDFFSGVATALGKKEPKIPARKILLSVVWRMLAVWSFISGKPAAITRETVASSGSVNRFDGSRITRMFGFTYRPLSETVRRTADIYLGELD